MSWINYAVHLYQIVGMYILSMIQEGCLKATVVRGFNDKNNLLISSFNNAAM